MLVIVAFFGCKGQTILEKHKSPNGKYVLQIELDNSQPKDQHLGFRLLTKNGKEIDYSRTLAGDVMKWAVTWYDQTTIIMDSHDVGTYGWTVDENGFKAMDAVSKDMEAKAIEAFKKKYEAHELQH